MSTRPTGTDADIFKALVEYSSDAIAPAEAQAGTRLASPSSERILGYAPEERVDHSAFELVHPDDLASVGEAFSRCLAAPGTAITSQIRVRHKDGTWRDVEAIAVNRLHQPAVAGIVVNYRDLTERRRAESALRTSDARLRHLFESAPDLIYYCSPDGRFTYVNPTAGRVMKYAEAQLIGRHFLTLIRPDHRERAAEFYSRQIAERTPNTYLEFPAITGEGATIWVGQHVQLVMEGGEIVGVQAIARDISRQKDTEERLRQSEAHYRSLIQHAPYGIYQSTVEGRILDANPTFVQMLGYDTVEQVLALNMKDLYERPDEREELIGRHRGDLGETPPSGVTWRRKDGTRLTVRIKARRVDRDHDGQTRFEGVVEDITERRVLEEQLRQSQKMEAVGRLARGIAHDFNNVLAAILGCAGLMQLRTKPGDAFYEDAEEIGRAAERGADLTRQLLAFSRRQAIVPEVLDVHAVLRAFERMLRRLSGGIAIRLTTPGPSPKVRAERGQIEQIVMNLIVNARDATPEGGSIEIDARIKTLGPREALRFPDLPPGRYARITVHDMGSGIEPETQRHVFEPFFTTKDPAKGTGLGLSIVYGIAKEAGGAVSFTSNAAEGTTFEVLLPTAEEGERADA